jgi:hypothetical protein
LWAIFATVMLAAIGSLVAVSGDVATTALLGASLWSVMFVPHLIRPFLTRRQIARIGWLPTDVVLEIDDQGVRMHEAGLESRAEGRLFRRVVVNAEIVALEYGPGRMVAIPRHVVSDAQIGELRALATHWSDSTVRIPPAG